MNIAFIGVGNMGAPMAINLARDNHRVFAFDNNKKQLEPLSEHGITVAESLKDALVQSEVVITMLPNDVIVNSVYLGSGGIKQHANEGALLIDCSTVSPACSKNLGKELNRGGFRYVEAPVSGGIKGAENAALAFICGGFEDVIETATPIISCMGSKIFRAGGYGAGAAAKLCNNLLLSIQMNATAEVLNMGKKLGLDANTLSEIMKNSSGTNWCLQSYNPCPGVMPESPASNHFKPGFSVALMQKDIGLAIDAAKSVDCHLPFGQLSQKQYVKLGEEEQNNMLDFSSIWHLYQ